MSHEGQLAKNTVIVAIGKISTQVLSYILLPLFTARMVASEYGTYDFLCTVSLFLVPIITMLMDEGLFRFLLDAETEEDKRRVISQTIIYCIFGIAVFIPIGILVLKLTTAYSNFLILSFIIFVISNVLVDVANAFSRGLSRIKIYSISNFILGVVTIILNILVLIFVPSAEGLLWANSIANIFTFFVVAKILHLRTYLSKPEKPLMKQMLQYSAPLVPNSISWKIINMSDRVLLTYMISSAANGIYAVSYKIPSILVMLQGIFSQAWTLSAVKDFDKDDKNGFFSKMYSSYNVSMVLACSILIIASRIMAKFLYQGEFFEAWKYVPFLLISAIFGALSGYVGGIFAAVKDTKIFGQTSILGAVVNLALTIVLVWKIGVIGAAISALVSNAVIWAIRIRVVKRYINMKLNLLVDIISYLLLCIQTLILFIWNDNFQFWCVETLLFIVLLLINKKILNTILRKITSKIHI